MNQAGELVREHVLARLHRVRPSIAAFMAPAGYGKSTIVRQFLADGGPVLSCDCAQATDDLRIVRAVVPEIAAELEDGSRTAAERVERAFEVWERADGRTIVFEKADALAGNDMALATLARLLATRPRGSRAVLVSRAPLPITLTRFAAPHEICVLRAHDIAFDESDLAALLAPQDAAAAAPAGYAATRGWPIAALLLKRLAAEGRLVDVLGRLDDVLADELREYLSDEVFATLGTNVARGIAACVALPHATAHDLRLAYPDAPVADDLAAYAVDSPFVTRGADDVFTVHPIVAAFVRARVPDRGHAMQRELSRAHAAAGSYARAAELALFCGDAFDAARMLATYELLDARTLPRGYLRVLAQLDASLVQRHPRLWGISTLYRMFRADVRALLDEAELVWRTLPLDASLQERYYIFVFRVGLLLAVGRVRDALAVADAFIEELETRGNTDARLADRVIAQRGIARARAGMLDAAESDLRIALAGVSEQDVAASGVYLALGAYIARVRGERALERQLLERAVEHAERARIDNYLAHPVAEALAGAWFAGEEARARELLERLESIVSRSDVGGFRSFAAAARGRSVEPTPTDMPRFVAFGHLMLLGQTRDEGERVQLARRTVADASVACSPFLIALANVALALCDDDDKDAAFAAAAQAAARCGSAAFAAAVDAVCDGRDDVGMLGPFVATVDRTRSRRPPPLALEALNALVRVDGRTVRLSGRELELLVALATRRDGMTRARLGALLWPDVEDADARNALSVLLHRLRAHLGRGDAIEREGESYRIERDAMVDLWELERAAARARVRAPLGERERAQLDRALAGVPPEIPEPVANWEWFEPTLRAVEAARAALFVRLANDALDEQRTDDALAYATHAFAKDPCDETACETAIRAYVLRGEHGSARRVFRAYRDALARELGAEPSAALAKLAGV